MKQNRFFVWGMAALALTTLPVIGLTACGSISGIISGILDSSGKDDQSPSVETRQQQSSQAAKAEEPLPRLSTPLTDDDFDYTQNRQGKITITKYLKKGKGIRDLVIPAQIQGVDVTEIGDKAFARGSFIFQPTRAGFNEEEGETFESVIIPATVTRIGADAFIGRGIKTLTLPAGLTYIGQGAFACNELTAVALPANLTFIGALAFADNELAAITLPAGLMTISSGAFGLNILTEIIIPANVTRINACAFAGNRISKITFSSSGKLSVIENAAFSDNRLTSVVLPEGLTTIEENGGKEIDNDYGVMRLSNLFGVNYIKGVFGGNPLAYIKIPSSLQGAAGRGNYRPITTGEVPVVEWQKPVSGMMYLGDAAALKIGDGVTINIDESFNNFYASQGRKAGIYLLAGKIWRTGTQAEFDALIAEKTAKPAAQQ
jgi:hypothetical protein